MKTSGRNLLLFFLTILHTSAFGQRAVVASGPTLEDRYPKRMGSLRTSATTLSFGRIKNNVTKSDTIWIYNSGRSTLNLTVDSKVPSHLLVKLGAGKLAPNESSWLSVTFDASKKGDYGFVLDRFFILTNDSVISNKVFAVTATLEEFFPPMTSEDSLMCPKARIASSIYDFGAIRSGDKTSHDFIIYNDGKRDLKIHKAKSSCGCIKTKFSRDVVPPSDSCIVSVEFDSFGKDGKENKSVTVYMNDPSFPEAKLEMTGVIQR